MRTVFISNYFNHHQKPLSDMLYLETGHQYSFIENEEMDSMRKNMGWKDDLRDNYVYSIDQDGAKARIDDAEAIIIGSAPSKVVRYALRQNKLFFRYSERPLKKGFEPLKYFPRLLKWHFQNPMSRLVYMLCASAYAPKDYKKFGLFKNRCYKWGYFPETRNYDIGELFSEKQPTQILWVGRFLEWKHPYDAIEIAKRLKKCGTVFHMSFIGIGEMHDTMRDMIISNSLSDCVSLLDQMHPDEVRYNMEHSGIFLFTSDKREGWGAVVNEAMNSGCAVVASDAAGSVPYLVKNNENGFVYHSGDINELFTKVKFLIDNPKEQRRLGEAAYRTISNLWNAEVAAKRFVELAQAIINGNKMPDLFDEGPCSRADIIQEDWYKNAS